MTHQLFSSWSVQHHLFEILSLTWHPMQYPWLIFLLLIDSYFSVKLLIFPKPFLMLRYTGTQSLVFLLSMKTLLCLFLLSKFWKPYPFFFHSYLMPSPIHFALRIHLESSYFSLILLLSFWAKHTFFCRIILIMCLFVTVVSFLPSYYIHNKVARGRPLILLLYSLSCE
jgi:hypothetical protein